MLSLRTPSPWVEVTLQLRHGVLAICMGRSRRPMSIIQGAIRSLGRPRIILLSGAARLSSGLEI